MSFKLMLVCAFVAACCYAQQSSAIELIEMTDANQAILLIDLSKKLASVQNAYKSGFDFKTVKDLKTFLGDCAYVNARMADSADDAFEGMATKIKAIMAESSIASACSVQSAEIKQADVEGLDTDYKVEEHDYLSSKKTAKLVEMRKNIEASPKLSLVLGKLINKRINDLAAASLENAAKNIEIFFDAKAQSKGFFDFNYMNYKSTCQIPAIKPICKLVRRTSDDDVSAMSADVADFINIINSDDQAKLATHEDASGLSMIDVRQACAGMKNGAGRFLRPIDLIKSWIDAGLMTEQQFQEGLAADRDLAFYNELSKLCKLTE